MDYRNKYNLDLKPGVDFRICENHWLPRKMGAAVFVFGKTMYFSGRMEKLPAHEYLHVAQFRKYGRLRVLMHYLYHLPLNYARSGNFATAFRNVPYEVEARNFESGRFADY
jgi:hypothetical protein